ncbi:MAG: 4a-hydroxytetrahydrobiopterin dehydratase [Myxococcales bacterium]|nr:4a-hydroxytetrahydrobiopterin dehydratase [Myxococcales bacterium]
MHDDWREVDGRLVRTFAFPDFATGLAFVVRVGALADEQDHHPDVHLRWGSVRLELWSHDVGAITGRDRRLATAIDELWP